jgi:prepilin-type N-terminal cleavage/methylation domain-containing protein/prepilin-type processing-associated H-X9-DG protein
MISPGPSRFTSARAFTLMELLVVITIIAVLAGLAFAAVGASQRRAQQAACAGNLRQIGAAMNAYAGENDGALPPISPDGNKDWNAGPWFPQVLKPYLPSQKIWNCPGQPLDRHFGLTKREWTTKKNAWYIPCYAFNANVAGRRLVNIAAAPGGMSQILLADGRAEFWDKTSVANEGYMTSIHNQKVNLLLVDGRVESKYKSDMVVTTNNASYDIPRSITAR